MIRAFIDEYGVPTPVFFCDACHEPITTMFGGMVVYSEAEELGACSPHFVCHKAPLCQSATRHKAGHLRGMGTWDEIPDYLVKLSAGTGIFPVDLAQRYESLWQREHVPDSEDSECSAF